MRNRELGILGVLVIGTLAAGAACSNGADPKGGAGASNAGGSSTPGGGGTSVVPGTGGAGPASCSSVNGCGGSVVGAWTVSSSCLKLSGEMDVSILSLSCPTVPVTGSLTTTGSFVANADGTYVDNTTTTGSVTFPLAASCLS